MLEGFRNWLAELVATDNFRRPAAPPKALPAAKPKPPQPTEAKTRAAEPDRAEELAALDRKLRQAEQRADKADERAKRAEAALKQGAERDKTSEKAIEQRIAAAVDKAKQAFKKSEERAKGKQQRRGKGDLDQKLRLAEDKAKGALERAQAAEARLAQADAQKQGLSARERELEQRIAELTERLSAAEAQASEAERNRLSKELREGGAGRGRPQTSVDVHFSPGDECFQAIRRQLEMCQRSADICVFTITDDRISGAIADAHRRGVRVRIITDNDKTHDEGSDIRRLAGGGIEVREDQSEFHMHHKFAVFDGKVMLTGSYNWTRGAARNNEENLVVSNDPRLVGPFDREFNALWTRLGSS